MSSQAADPFSFENAVVAQDLSAPVSNRPATGYGSSPIKIPLNEIICALSFALDLTEGAVPGHAIRSCLYGMRIAEELKLSSAEKTALYYALLLKDVGCSSNSARMCLLTGGDDRLIKHDVKFLDWTRPSVKAVTTLWNRALPEGTPMERVLRIVRLGLDQQRNNAAMIQLRCDRGASIARKIGLSEATAEAIRLLDEHWDGSGYPNRLRGKEIPLLARIAAVAQHLDVFGSELGLDRAVDELAARSGRWFDPELVCLVILLQCRGTLAEGFVPQISKLNPSENPNQDPNQDHRTQAMELDPTAGEALAAEDIDTICEAFADVVDAKSSFTYTHSVSVTRAAVGIAGELGFDAERTRMVYRASLLHDLGKLSVPNTILDKPGRLDCEEWAVVKRHAALSEEILGRISQFGVLAKMAGQHHERLDGSGYPHGLTAEQLTLDSRVIAVADIFSALAESRPYRKNLDPEHVLFLLKKDVPRRLDADCYEALLRFIEKGGRVTSAA